jgi:ketopantoate reductase
MRLELPWLCGRVAELGRKHGLGTPVNDTVVLGLKLHSDGRGCLRRLPRSALHADLLISQQRV